MKYVHFVILIGLTLLMSACAHHDQIQPLPDPARASAVTPPPPPTTAGSLWNERQGGLFYDQKGRFVGDIITVAIQESASASKEATTATGRTSTMSAGITQLLGLERTIQKATDLDPSTLVNASTTNNFSGTGATTRSENLTTTLTTQIIEILPNGNLRIEGGKTVRVNNETQIVLLTGVVRPQDVSASNIVNSNNVLDARIDYTGKGTVSDKQKPGWAVRLLDALSPF